MSREQKRKLQREIKLIVADAKQDMADWLANFPAGVTESEAMAWQAGYIAGINRMNNDISSGK